MLRYRSLRLYTAVICALAVHSSLTAGAGGSDWRVARRLDRVLEDSALDGAFVGLLAVDLKTGKTIYSRNPDHLFLPASNQKLLTTAAALYWLGPSFKYATIVYATDSVSSDSVLLGNLVVRGSGDPSLSETFGSEPDSVFLALADSLKARGIARVAGSVVTDESLFDRNRLGYGWDWHYLSFWYAPEVSALSCYDNSVVVRMGPGKLLGDKAEVSVSPTTSYVSVENRAHTVGPDDESSVAVWRDPGTNKINVAGSLALGSAGKSYRVSVSDPALFFANRVTEVLRGASIKVDRDPLVLRDTCSTGLIVFSHHSPDLESIVAVTNRSSANLSAEMLLKTLGASAYKEGTFDSGARAVKAYLSVIGVDTSRLHTVDGSGLSRRDLVSPRLLVELLKANWDENGSGFVNSLPVSGSPGTLEKRMCSERLIGRVRAKTGTLDQTSALAGYLTTERGRPLAFALMSNHFLADLTSVRAAEEEIVGVLARYRPRYKHPWERR